MVLIKDRAGQIVQKIAIGAKNLSALSKLPAGISWAVEVDGQRLNAKNAVFTYNSRF